LAEPGNPIKHHFSPSCAYVASFSKDVSPKGRRRAVFGHFLPPIYDGANYVKIEVEKESHP